MTSKLNLLHNFYQLRTSIYAYIPVDSQKTYYTLILNGVLTCCG